MTAGQYIDYEALAQEAMRGIIRAVLLQIAKSGLHGDHHFYIAFNTQAPGVVLSKRLREKYPSEMTIVLQHRFWDLAVGDDRFEVKLTFDGIPELLAIPFKSIKVFYDPSVPYGLQFEESELATQAGRRGSNRDGSAAGEADEQARIVGMQDNSQRPEHRVERTRKPRTVKAERGERSGEQRPAAPTPAAPVAAVEKAARQGGEAGDGAPPAAASAKTPAARPVLAEVKQAEPAEETAAEPAGAKVVDLSKFRKK